MTSGEEMIDSGNKKVQIAQWWQIPAKPAPVKAPPKRVNSAKRLYREFCDKTKEGYKKGKLDSDIAPVDLRKT